MQNSGQIPPGDHECTAAFESAGGYAEHAGARRNDCGPCQNAAELQKRRPDESGGKTRDHGGISVRELEKMAKRANEEKPEKADKPAKRRIRYYDEPSLHFVTF